MAPAFLFFFVLATAAPLLSAGQPFSLNYLTANPSTGWNNTDASLDGNPCVRLILICPLQPQPTKSISLAFAVGFLCAPYPIPAGMFLLDCKSIINSGTSITDNDPPIVWCANRSRPVRENAILEFTSDGNLVLRDADGSHVWSSNSSGQSVSGMRIT
jgi:hypothetical protein